MLIGLDLDGTLIDSRLRHVAALLQAAEACSVLLSENEAQTHFRLKREGSSGIQALRQLGIPLAENIIRRWVEIIESEEMVGLDRLYSDTLQALKLQRDRQDTFVLVTGRQNQALARRQIAKLGLEEFFCGIIVVDPRDCCQTKAAVTRPYDLSTIVGDTELDLQWAADLGSRFYASSYGFRSESYWHRRQVTSYASLSEIFDAINLLGCCADPIL
jgi:phosphoglycolate phosphatase-like HAD superfamily hydrolase